METIKKGEDISTFECVAIVIKTAKRERREGEGRSKYMELHWKSTKGGREAVDNIFEDEGLSYMTQLEDWGCVKDGGVVDMFALADKFDDLYAEAESTGKRGKLRMLRQFENNLLVKQGAVIEWYKFQKGLCYSNDAEGNRTKYKDGTFVTADGIPVLCQIDFQSTDEEGKTKTHWVLGYSPQERGARLERNFWKVPVNQPPVNTGDTNQPPLNQPPVNTNDPNRPPF